MREVAIKNSARLITGALLSVLFGVAAVPSASPQGAAPRPAVPVDPVTAVLDAFRSHSVVALSEGDHGNEQSHAFRLALIRDPRFVNTVNDIVVESGSARYQDVMDRFVRGEEVPYEVLRQVWQNTTVPNPVWDRPMYEEFFRAVRAVNASLARERQLRILVGDPPVCWERVQRKEDSEKLTETVSRDHHATDLIRREVLAKNRRALVVYDGNMHFVRKHAIFNYESSEAVGGHTIASLLEESTPSTKVFTIWTDTPGELWKLQADVASWAKPSLAMLRGTALGAADFTSYYTIETARFPLRDGKPDFSRSIPRDQWRSRRMEDQFDAVLYLGPQTEMTIARLSPARCADRDFIKMRITRMTLAGFAQGEIDRLLQRYCPTQASR